jgi:hypothetical protein
MYFSHQMFCFFNVSLCGVVNMKDFPFLKACLRSCIAYYFLRFEVLTAVLPKIEVHCDVMLCQLG